MALAVGAEECANKADDLTGLVPPRRYCSLTVPAFSLFSRHLTYSSRFTTSGGCSWASFESSSSAGLVLWRYHPQMPYLGRLDVCCQVLSPQLLDLPLRTTQQPVDQKRVGVGRYLRRDPGGQPDERGGHQDRPG